MGNGKYFKRNGKTLYKGRSTDPTWTKTIDVNACVGKLEGRGKSWVSDLGWGCVGRKGKNDRTRVAVAVL